MIERTLARRYAGALLDVAVREQRVRDAEEEMRALAVLFRASPDFRTALVSPVIPRGQRQAAAARALSGRVGPSTAAFIDVLIGEGRAGFLPQIAEAFDALADAHAGVVRVRVEAARAPTAPQRTALQAALGTLSGGRQVEMDVRVDAALIGGLRVRVGDAVIDGSVAGRLKRLKENLLMAGMS